ncbi:hypothetical protein VNO77_02524 [Canavalia gladiata]|uniref:Uncharacterized protein n=1 Tax=Canavalia gladiata TaxID=3824 RepID=A0AAN9MTT9_CANGL
MPKSIHSALPSPAEQGLDRLPRVRISYMQGRSLSAIRGGQGQCDATPLNCRGIPRYFIVLGLLQCYSAIGSKFRPLASPRPPSLRLFSQMSHTTALDRGYFRS